jgi:hypothetical protein
LEVANECGALAHQVTWHRIAASLQCEAEETARPRRRLQIIEARFVIDAIAGAASIGKASDMRGHFRSFEFTATRVM